MIAAADLERIGPLAERASLVVAEASTVAGARPGTVAARLARDGRLVLLTDYPETTAARGVMALATLIDKQHLEPALGDLLARLHTVRETRP